MPMKQALENTLRRLEQITTADGWQPADWGHYGGLMIWNDISRQCRTRIDVSVR